jgi:hypothetical protein
MWEYESLRCYKTRETLSEQEKMKFFPEILLRAVCRSNLRLLWKWLKNGARTQTHAHTHTHAGNRTNRFIQLSDIIAYARVSNICLDTNYAYRDLRNFTQSFQPSTDIVQSEWEVPVYLSYWSIGERGGRGEYVVRMVTLNFWSDPDGHV